jgi:hypothetical protein
MKLAYCFPGRARDALDRQLSSRHGEPFRGNEKISARLAVMGREAGIALFTAIPLQKGIDYGWP